MVSNTNKFKKFDYIELDKLYVGLSNVRVENATDEELGILAEHIGKHGLLEPIVVFEVNDLGVEHPLYETRKKFKNQFEILTGQRRWNSFKKLNQENPGEGWDKIPCHIRKPPENDLDAKAISIGENLTQLPMTLQDSINAVSALFDKLPDERVVSKKFGISIQMVRKFVKVARLPPLLKEQLGVLNKNPKTAVNLAVEAADALNWSKDSGVSENTVYELAKKLAEKKMKSQEEYVKLKQAAEENPTESLQKIEDESIKIMNPKKYLIVLDAKTSKMLEEYSKSHEVLPEKFFSEFLSKHFESQDNE